LVLRIVIITGASTDAINFITDKLNVFCDAGNQLSYIISISLLIYKVSVLIHTKRIHLYTTGLIVVWTQVIISLFAGM